MLQTTFVSNLIVQISNSWKLVFLIFIVCLFSSSHSASLMTLSSSSTYHHFEFISNDTYRNFFLRQYFIDLLNNSHSSLVQSMIANHHLVTNLEQIQYRRRRHIPIKPFSLTPILTVHSTNCVIINHNQVQSTFQWSHSMTSLSSIEIIYHINTNEIQKSSIPIRIRIKHSQTSKEFLSINTYLQFDSIRDFYVLNLYDYFSRIDSSNFIIESIIDNQTCQTSQTYIILSSLKSKGLSSDDHQQKTTCKLKTIQIKFEELGLAYLIIRPKEYTFNYCDGSCFNLTFQQQLQKSSLHSYLQSLISQTNVNIPQPTCSPTQYADDNFLLRQPDGSMEIYPIKNVIVKQCACL